MRKVGLSDNIRRVVKFDPKATEGAVVGRNLFLADGAVVTEEMLFGDGTQEPQDPAFTYWGLIQEVPANLRELAKLAGEGFSFRNDDGTWRLRNVGRQVVDFAYGDATPAPIFTATHPLLVVLCRLAIRTAFDGAGAELVIGTAAVPDLVHVATENDPATVGGYESTPTVVLDTGDVLQIAITPGAGATAGSGQIFLDTVPLEGI